MIPITAKKAVGREVFGALKKAVQKCWHTSRSVVMRTLLEPERNSFIITSLSFCSMSPCYWKNKRHKFLFKHHLEFSKSLCHTYQGRNGKISRVHFFSQPVHLPASVDEYHSLGDCQSFIEITQRVQFPLLNTEREKIRKNQKQNHKPLS